MLAYYFPPENAIGGARPSRFSKYLSRLGFDTAVVAANPPGVGPSDKNVVRVPDRADSLRASYLLRMFERFALPYDDRLPWIPHGYRAAARLLTQNPDQIVLSTHPPVATHLVALLLKRRFNIKWIADFRDPLRGNAIRNGWRAKLIDNFIERLIFRHADAVIANTAGVRNMWQQRHPHFVDKIHLIWNGFDHDETVEPHPVSNRAARRLVHVGTIYGSRSPGPLIGSLCRLQQAGRLQSADFQLRLIGPIQNDLLKSSAAPLAQLHAAGCVHIDNRMAPQADAQAEIVDADYLVLLDMINDENAGLQLPAKIFDYIRACRPILAFTRPGSAIHRILDISGVRNTSIDPFADEATIDAAVEAFLNERLEATEPNTAFWHDFNAEHQTETLVRIIAKL